MARYLHRNCPRCNGYVAIVLSGPGRNTPLQAVNGQCSGCSYRLAWIVIRGKRNSARGLERQRRLSKWK
jgi:C4-type Zn-finger protein